jgi:hypothetical protein
MNCITVLSLSTTFLQLLQTVTLKTPDRFKQPISHSRPPTLPYPLEIVIYTASAPYAQSQVLYKTHNLCIT